MAPPSPGSSPGAAPLPPLPNLSSGGQGDASTSGAASGGMAGIMSGLAPVKMGVDGIVKACQTIVKSGVIPGSEQICGQIIALATSLLPMAAQAVLQPIGGGGPGGAQPQPQQQGGIPQPGM